MISKKKFSLSILNNILFLVFLLIISVSIIIGTYLNTQKVIDKNISDYFNQTHNLGKLIIDNEQSFLEAITYEVSSVLYTNNKLNDYDIIISEIQNFESIDDLDLLFFKSENSNMDFSNSLFNTEALIEKISQINISSEDKIISVKIDKEDILLILNKKKIVDKNTGRVKAELYAGKIFNDNYSLLNKIKQKAKLENVFMSFNSKVIATTAQDKNILDIELFKSESTIVKNNIITSNKFETIANGRINFIYISKNSSFEVLKDSLVEQAYILIFFVIIIFILLYFFTNRFIIVPFSKLHNYAHKLKNDDDIEYKNTQIEEFDDFAYELKDIIYELRDLKEKYSRAIDGVQDGLWDVDFKTKKIFYSKRFLSMLGYEEDDKVNNVFFWSRHIHKEDYKSTINKLKEHFNHKTELFENEYRFRCKDGTYKWIKIRGKAFFDENNNVINMTGFHTDINDLISLQNENVRKEQMLYQQSKLAAMGEMIGNIAHQWRQPLTIISVIGSSIGMQLKMKSLKEEEALKDIDKLLDTVKYLSSIIDKFRHFFNPDNKVEEFYVEEMLKENLEIFETSYKTNNIELIIDTPNIKIIGYKFELMQVIVNIINNAKDALVENLDKADDKFIFIKSYNENEKVVIKIYDNAGGIEADLKEKIYEPYFTTKHKSQGTGLGLYMSNEIIRKHFNGKLSNKTVDFNYNDINYKGEEFTIEI